MTTFAALVQNENMKIYRRLRSWIMMGVLLLLVIGGCVLDTVNNHDSADWKKPEAASVQAYKDQLTDPKVTGTERTGIEKQLMLSEYRLKHDVPYHDESSMWGAVGKYASLIGLITIFAAVVAGDSVASEFSWGTIKLLLIRPAGRAQILLSKYLAVMLFALFMLLLLFAGSMIAGGLFYGFQGTDIPHLIVKDGAVHEMSMIVYQIQSYALRTVALVMIVSFAFMISSVFRSSSLSIALSIVLMFVGSSVAFMFKEYEWAKYILFAHTDLSLHLSGTPMIEGTTMGFSAAVLIAYFFLFNVSSWLVFSKRDVTNG